MLRSPWSLVGVALLAFACGFVPVPPHAAALDGQPPVPVDATRSDIAPLVDRGMIVEIDGDRYVDGAAVAAAAETLAVVDSSAIGYDRDRFEHWRDPDRNGCDARNDILRRDLVDVVMRDGSDCVVQQGTLHDPYTGATIAFQRGQDTSSAVQIDHIVPLAAAWTGGANTWDDASREAFANDPVNLQAVDGETNAEKGQMLPGEWMPSNGAFRCTYLAQVTNVLTGYGLAVTALDRVALVDAATDCPLPGNASAPTGTPPAATTVTSPTTATPTATPDVVSVGAARVDAAGTNVLAVVRDWWLPGVLVFVCAAVATAVVLTRRAH